MVDRISIMRGENGFEEHPTPRIEFVGASALEYLARWKAANALFHDDVRLVSLIEWKDGSLSFGITQPQYHGRLAELREIETFFLNHHWTRLRDPSGHVIFYDYANDILAIDAERRNCYMTEEILQPFDVILCQPDERMKGYLGTLLC